MRGRDVLLDSLALHGVELVFGNPGTTESPLLDGLAARDDIRYVTALHEGVALGAASYYAQASGRTGVVNVHVAPGLGNALGMLYGALKAGSPLLVTAGQQDTRLRLSDPVLGHDLVAMARPLVKWSVEPTTADEMAPILQRAFKIAHDPPEGPVFVSLPIDVMEQETTIGATAAGLLYRRAQPDPAGVAAAARLLAASAAPVIVAGDDVARGGASAALMALAEQVGAQVWHEGLHMHAAVPSGHPHVRLGLPLDPAGMRQALDGADLVLLVGGPFFEHVWFAPGGSLPAGAKVVQLEATAQRLAGNFTVTVGIVGDLAATLTALSAALARAEPAEAGPAAARRRALAARKTAEVEAQAARARKAWTRRPVAMARVMAEVRAALPPGAIVVDETITASLDLARTLEFGGPGDYFGGRGGGIGQGLAGALGVKAAMPERPVVCLSGDGSAMYSIQALWTSAHAGLPVVFVILANGEYRVLKHNLDIYRDRFAIRSNATYPHMDLAAPALGFVDMARGMGVAGERVEDGDDIAAALVRAFASGAPYLVEIAVERKR